MGTDIWRPVRGELRRILLGVSGVPNDRIQYEGRDFTPPSDLVWLKERIDKGSARTVTLGAHGMVEERAIYVIDLNVPRKSSFADGEDLADAIRCAYWHGRGIVGMGTDPAQGNVLAVHLRSAIPFGNLTQFPIRVDFFFRRNTLQGHL